MKIFGTAKSFDTIMVRRQMRQESGVDMLSFLRPQRSAFSWDNDGIPMVSQLVACRVGADPKREPAR
ncbi:MAG: hypothetical protein M3Q19_05950 [Pseudomonadota bacterium]|nr:hypothetical protein [Pseudomonadota bacterium]